MRFRLFLIKFIYLQFQIFERGLLLKLKEFNWVSGIFIITYHIALFALLPYYLLKYTPSFRLLWVSALLLGLCGLSLSAGYHRYYAHRAYRPNKVLEVFLLFFATVGIGSNVLRWSHEHRIHHKHTDTDHDPHSIKKGFMYAHMWWVFKKSKEIDMSIVQDLAKNKLVMFQYRFYTLLATATNVLVLGLIWLFTGDLFGTLVFAFLARVFLFHHFTWFINSLAHTWGSKTYSGEQTAVDNYMMALLTWGEGYHNYHHVFASDYRNGIKWYHFDPSKWMIWTMAKIGFASELKRMSPMTIKRTIIKEDKKILLEKLQSAEPEKKNALETKVNELSELLLQKISEMGTLISEYSSKTKTEKRTIKMKLKELRKSFGQKWDEWVAMSREITSMDRKSDFKYSNAAA
jgi:stearoyl-CoA desaturase (Delta-9 desaturase)